MTGDQAILLGEDRIDQAFVNFFKIFVTSG